MKLFPYFFISNDDTFRQGGFNMKRIIFALLALVLAFPVFAGGQTEEKSITILHAPEGNFSVMNYAAGKLEEDFPGVEVVLMQVDLSDGSTLTMDAMLAAGIPPNVYVDYIGRTSKYLVPEYALPLDEYIRDLDAYFQSSLAPYRTDEKLLGLPQPGGAQGMAINMQIMEEIGFTPTFDWTIPDFLAMAELVKAHYSGEKYATGMFAGNQSGDYLINNWFPVFGAQWFADGYSSTTIDRDGADVYRFFHDLVINGYIPPNAATLVDDDYVIQWAKGDIAATAFFPGWLDPYFQTVIEQGMIDEPFPVEFFPFPNSSPTYVSNSAIVVHETGTEADVWAARFAEYANDAYSQSQQSLNNVIPNRADAAILSDSPWIEQTGRIMQQNGIFDVGLTQPFFARTRPQHFPVLQKVLNMEYTPEEAIAEYARRLNEALKE